MSTATEIVQFKIQEGILSEDFIAIVDGLEKNYHSKQPGFVDTELLFDDESGTWIMLQHWETMEKMKAASEKMFSEETAKPFIEALQPESVNMSMLPQLKKWIA